MHSICVIFASHMGTLCCLVWHLGVLCHRNFKTVLYEFRKVIYLFSKMEKDRESLNLLLSTFLC